MESATGGQTDRQTDTQSQRAHARIPQPGRSQRGSAQRRATAASWAHRVQCPPARSPACSFKMRLKQRADHLDLLMCMCVLSCTWIIAQAHTVCSSTRAGWGSTHTHTRTHAQKHTDRHTGTHTYAHTHAPCVRRRRIARVGRRARRGSGPRPSDTPAATGTPLRTTSTHMRTGERRTHTRTTSKHVHTHTHVHARTRMPPRALTRTLRHRGEIH